MAAEVVHRTAHVPDWKIKEVEELKERIGKSRVVGVVGMREIPASDLQQMRGELRGAIEIKMVRNSIARRALEASNPEIKPLAGYVGDQTALIFSDESPFKLYSKLEKAKRPMPLKAGSKAPKDIVVQAGETSFSPGPMVGKLQAAGIPAAIKGGKVVINSTLTLIKEGETVSPKVADILKTMEIFPRNVGMDLKAAYEGDLVFQAKDLALDIDKIVGELATASVRAFNFAIEVGYATPETITTLLQKAQANARNLVAEESIPEPSMMEIVLSRAAAKAQAIARLVSGEAQAVAPAAAPAQAAAPAEKEDEKKDEEAGVEGLGTLFG
jgi:large subunit ribosomal protein L10